MISVSGSGNRSQKRKEMSQYRALSHSSVSPKHIERNALQNTRLMEAPSLALGIP